jgi:hypothetical protein
MSAKIEEGQLPPDYDPEEAGIPEIALTAAEAYEALSGVYRPIHGYREADRIAWESLGRLLSLDRLVADEPIPDKDATSAMSHLSALLPFDAHERNKLVGHMVTREHPDRNLLKFGSPEAWYLSADDQDLAYLGRWRRWLFEEAAKPENASGAHAILESLADFRRAIRQWTPSWVPPVEDHSPPV